MNKNQANQNQASQDQKPSEEDKIHDVENKITLPIECDLNKNIKNIDMLFKDCMDVVKREVDIGIELPIKVYGVYIDGMVNRDIIESFFLSPIVEYKNLGENKESISALSYEPTKIIMDNFSATFDIKEVTEMDKMVAAVLSGDTALFVEGTDKGLVVATRGWPVRGVSAPETEAVIRGPRDGFVETIRFNTVLIRRRIRDTKLKVKMISVGLRSRTDVAIMYMEDIAKPELLEDLMRRLNHYEIDGVMDSGYIEQLIEDSWKSPFPQTQATERPDKVAASLLEGKIAIVVDNSPFVILVPATLNTFYQASEDYYQRWQIMSFTRILRYIVSFLSFALPALYIATLNFHPAMLPTDFAISIAASRDGVAFATVIEIVIMETAFELLREAGLRLPSAVGHAIGIVGGIVIGQAAVDAKIISPMIVIIVAITAISTFAIPDYSLTTAFRVIRYMFIGISAIFGLYGFLIGLLILIAHLSSLESFKIPYLAPYTATDVNGYNDLKDTILRFPLFMQNRRPIFARDNQKIRIRLKNSDSKAQTPPGPDSIDSKENTGHEKGGE